MLMRVVVAEGETERRRGEGGVLPKARRRERAMMGCCHYANERQRDDMMLERIDGVVDLEGDDLRLGRDGRGVDGDWEALNPVPRRVEKLTASRWEGFRSSDCQSWT
jgi:hypothetical protein